MKDSKMIQKFPAGIVSPPPSKSLAHRAAICAWLASKHTGQESVLYNMHGSDDILATLAGIRALGGRWVQQGDTVQMMPAQQAKGGLIDCNESGSTLRFLLPLAALDDAEYQFTGKGRLMERPLDIYADIFAKAGVAFRRQDKQLYLKGPLQSGVYKLPGNVSSQFVSGLLFALPLLAGDSALQLTTELESRAYVDMTVDVMRQFGVSVEQPDAATYRIAGGQHYRPASYTVEADYSQAAFFLAAAALGRPVVCQGLSRKSLQGDRAILNILHQMGADVQWREDGSLAVSAERLQAVTVDAREIPDLMPPVAVLCSFCAGESRIVNAGRLRIKESDRLAALTQELTALGAQVEETADSLIIQGAKNLAGGRVDAHGDHRIAMAMATAAIGCGGAVYLTGAESVRKSYPNFWDDFEQEARV